MVVDNVPDYVVNLNRIHPLKQWDVVEIVKCFAHNKAVKYIVLFGSAARFDCSSNSDIDMCVQTSNNQEKLLLPYDNISSEVDLFENLNEQSRLFHNAESKGVVVFERE